MALIDCPECGREVSGSAVACPECAYPVATGTPPMPVRAMTPSARVAVAAPSGGLELTKQIVGRVLLGGALLFSSVVYEAEPVLIGALIVLGSSIPIWIKARRAEKLATGGGGIGRPKGQAINRRFQPLAKRGTAAVPDRAESE